MSDSDEKFDMVLEAPPQADSPIAGMGSAKSGSLGLFADDMFAVTAAKFAIVESFLKSITRDQSYSDFVRELLIAVMKVVKSEAGSVFEVDQERKILFFRAVVGTQSDRVSNFVIPMGQGVVGHVAEARLPLTISNIAENKLHLKAIQDAVGFEARNLIAAPIVVRSKIFGVLELLNRIGEPDYSQADVELVSYACEMAAKAIEARLMIAWASRGGSGSAPGDGTGA